MLTQVRLGTRGSGLALKQAEIVKNKLQSFFPALQVHTVIIKTQGDIDLKSPLSEIGGKGVFIKELEKALLNNEIDMAVHSLKDVTSSMPPSLCLGAFLQAESCADALVSKPGFTLDNLPIGASVATGSIRRQALLKKLRPDVHPVPIRGNIQTRLQKLEDPTIQAVLLSEAGLMRMGCADFRQVLDPALFFPAPGQGVITLQVRREDSAAKKLCEAINHPEQAALSSLELQLLMQVGFDCRIPLGVYTSLHNGVVQMQAFLASTTLTHWTQESFTCPQSKASEQVLALTKRLLAFS